jgi:Holliday junction DNA helicase RuvA
VIARLKGLLDAIGADHVVVDVGGVGYLVFCSGRTLASLPAVGEAVAFHIETHVREDHIHLFGFLEPAERDWFKLLQGVQGVGARVALGLLSVLGPSDLVQAVAMGERTMLTRAPGVGAKLAGRIAQELKDKVADIALAPVAAAHGQAAAPAGPENDAVSALVNLGYRPIDAATAVRTAMRDLGTESDLEDLIRSSLRELAG